MRFSEQNMVGTAPELEKKTKRKQESIEEPNKNDKTCKIGHDTPEGSVGPRNNRNGFRQPCPSYGWVRRWFGLLVCCLALAPASAVAHPLLDETQMLNDRCRLDALNRSPTGSSRLTSSVAAMAAAVPTVFEGRLDGHIGTLADNATCLQTDLDGCNPCSLVDVGLPTLKGPLSLHSCTVVGLPTSVLDELVEYTVEYGFSLFLSDQTGLVLCWTTGLVFLAWMVGGLLAYQQITKNHLQSSSDTTSTRTNLKRKLLTRRRLTARHRKQARLKNQCLEAVWKTFLEQQCRARLRGTACRRRGLGRGKVQRVAGARLRCRRAASFLRPCASQEAFCPFRRWP